MRDDDDGDDDLISDDDEILDGDATDEAVTLPGGGLGKLEARRKLERLRERKLLRQQLGEDWSDDLLDDDF